MHFFKRDSRFFAKNDSILIKTKHENENKAIVKNSIDDKVLVRM